jgi:NADPH2:quinone reductase
VVEAIGPGVGEVAVGERVAYAGRPLGAYAEARVMPVGGLVRVPGGVSAELAAAVMLKGLTAWYLLRRTHEVGAGTTILVHAAAGGVGSLLCQWGRELGARVLGVVGSEEKAVRARRDGCEEVCVRATDDFVERVRAWTDGRGVDVVYDSVGRDTFRGSLDCLRPRGLMVSFGQSSGPVPAMELGELASRGSLFLTRPSLMDYTAERAELVLGARELFGLLEAGALTCHVGARFPLREAAAAHAALEGRRTVGSSVLLP